MFFANGQIEVKQEKRAFRREFLLIIFSLLFLWGYAAILLDHMGAFRADFNGNPDEASHVMTGVLIRDYLVSGVQQPPIRFAERHYLAYPKSSFGIWPPLFHFAEGAWFLIFEPSRWSTSLLMSTLLAIAGLISGLIFRDEIEPFTTAILVMFLVGSPLLVKQFSVVIADAILFPLMLLSVCFFIRYLETHFQRDSILFGFFAGLAFLTKYNAASLVLVPVIGIALTRQWKLLKNPTLWAAPLVVLLIAGPWYVLQFRTIIYAADMGPNGFPLVFSSGIDNFMILAKWFGAVGGCLILVGTLGTLFTGRRSSAQAACWLGLLLGTWVMHSFVYPILIHVT